MKTYHIPRVVGEALNDYTARVSNIAWVFYSSNRALQIQCPMVTLDGEAPDGFVFPEVQDTYHSPKPAKKKKTHAEVWEAIKEQRDRLQVAGVWYAGYWFHNDVKSRGQWERMNNRCVKEGLVGTNPYVLDNSQVLWKTLTNAFVPLTAGLIFGVVDAMEVQEAKIFKVAELHRMSMLGSDDPTNYPYMVGWPEVYG